MSDNTILTEGKPIGYRDVFKQKQYIKLIFANVINRFGDSIDSIAFTWLVFTLTNSAAWSAVIFGINRLPTIFLQPFAGALVENMNKKLVMVLTDIIRGICVCTVAVMFLLNILNPWILIVETLIISSAEAFRGPAGMAVLPRILEKEYYEYGLSLNSSLSNVMELIGLASTGSIIAFFGTQTAIFIDAVTFFCSAAIITFINSKEQREIRKKSDFKQYFEALKGGFLYIKSKPVIRNFVLLAAVANGVLVPLNSLLAPLVKDLLKQREMMLSVISFSLTIGLALGAAIYPYVSKKVKTKAIVFISGVTLSLYYLLFSLCGYLTEYAILVYAICVLSSFVAGIQLELLSSALNVQFMKQIETEYLARLGAIMGAICVGSIPVVSFFVGVMTSMLSLSAIFYILSGVGLIFFVIILLKRVRFE